MLDAFVFHIHWDGQKKPLIGRTNGKRVKWETQSFSHYSTWFGRNSYQLKSLRKEITCDSRKIERIMALILGQKKLQSNVWLWPNLSMQTIWWLAQFTAQIIDKKKVIWSHPFSAFFTYVNPSMLFSSLDSRPTTQSFALIQWDEMKATEGETEKESESVEENIRTKPNGKKRNRNKKSKKKSEKKQQLALSNGHV